MGMVVDRELEDVEAVIGGVDDVVFNDSTFIVDLLSSVVDGLKDMMRLVQVLQESKVKKKLVAIQIRYIYQRLLITRCFVDMTLMCVLIFMLFGMLLT